MWKNNNKKWWMSPEGYYVDWPLAKKVSEKNLCRLKPRKVVRTKSSEGILEVKYMSHGDGSTVGNVKDGFNVRKVCKIIKNLRRVSTLHRTIDV